MKRKAAVLLSLFILLTTMVFSACSAKKATMEGSYYISNVIFDDGKDYSSLEEVYKISREMRIASDYDYLFHKLTIAEDGNFAYTLAEKEVSGTWETTATTDESIESIYVIKPENDTSFKAYFKKGDDKNIYLQIEIEDNEKVTYVMSRTETNLDTAFEQIETLNNNDMTISSYMSVIDDTLSLNPDAEITDNISDMIELNNKEHYNAAVALKDSGAYKDAITAFVALGDYSDSKDKITECCTALYGENVGKTYGDILFGCVGDIVTFGNYEQDNESSNGKEAIEWEVLEKEGSKVTLISKYALDCKPYNTEYENVTWEDCTLRSWLNNDFYNSAFSEDEKKLIITTKVTADKNPKLSTNPGNDTEDKVYLLSIKEVQKYFSTYESIKCAPTAYAKANGAYTIDEYTTAEGEASCWWWWLRSPGDDQHYAAGVLFRGVVDVNGHYVGDNQTGVRPVLTLNLES